MKYVFPQDIL